MHRYHNLGSEEEDVKCEICGEGDGEENMLLCGDGEGNRCDKVKRSSHGNEMSAAHAICLQIESSACV